MIYPGVIQKYIRVRGIGGLWGDIIRVLFEALYDIIKYLNGPLNK